MANEMRVSVTSIAFSTCAALREELLAITPRVRFNDDKLRFDEDGLVQYLEDAHVAIVGLDLVTPQLLQRLPNLKMIAKYGVGLDNIHDEVLRGEQVAIGWTPGVNRRSVAELALTFMLGLSRNVWQTGWRLKHGSWHKDGGRELSGSTVAVVGCGHIGGDVLRLLQPFGVKPLLVDIEDRAALAQEFGGQQVGLAEALARADVVTLHVPLTDKTLGMIGASALATMKPGSFLINTSRGGVVDQGALQAALVSGSIGGAGLDVFAVEPPEDAAFLQLENLMVTPHIGGNSAEAVLAMGRSALDHVRRFSW